MGQFSFFQVCAGLVLALIVSFSSFRFRLLTVDGAIAAGVLGTVIFGLCGLSWAVPMIVFFFSSSLVSRSKPRTDSDLQFEKTSIRDSWQVLANGGVGGVLSFLQFLVPDDKWCVAYLGSVAAVTADTWGTEVGMLTTGRVFLITRLQRVPRGTSGGISVVGTLAGGSGALLIAVIGSWFGDLSATATIHVGVAGMAGSLLDSLLGATVQGQYRCPRCGVITEKLRHCDSPAVLCGGYRWLSNDWVNLTCAVGGALVVYFSQVFL